MVNDRVTVLMSTYNGEKYLEEQLDSIFSQSGVDVKLVVRDDGSTDRTLEILYEYKKKHSNMNIIYDGKNLGACKSFLKLIRENTDSKFFALADQDDVWDEDKLQVAVKKMVEQEPTLYFSNLRIVDKDMNFIRNSHNYPQTIDHKYAFLSVSLPTGCTIVYNYKLAKLVADASLEDYSMHDTWLYGVCSMFGKVIYDFEPHINYRLHEDNVVGALKKNSSFAGIKREMKYIFNKKNRYRSNNAKVLFEKFSSCLDDEKNNKLIKMKDYRKSIRNMLSLLCDSDFNPNGFYRKIRYKLMILLHTL